MFLLAPAPLLPLGLILLRTPVLPWPFAPAAVILGVTGPVLGLTGLFTVTTNNNGLVGAAITRSSPRRNCGSSPPRRP